MHWVLIAYGKNFSCFQKLWLFWPVTPFFQKWSIFWGCLDFLRSPNNFLVNFWCLERCAKNQGQGTKTTTFLTVHSYKNLTVCLARRSKYLFYCQPLDRVWIRRTFKLYVMPLIFQGKPPVYITGGLPIFLVSAQKLQVLPTICFTYNVIHCRFFI